MAHLSKKALSIALAAVISASAISWNVLTSSAADGTKYEFEDGKTGTSAVKTDDNASGGKYVYLEKNDESIAVTASVATAGMYEVTIRYSAPFGDKVQNLYVNGVDQGQCSFQETAESEWVDLSFGSVKLNAGDNEIMIKGSWGWTNFDYVEIESATLGEIYASDVTCCDKDATQETQNLMSYLASVYGKHIISGQQEIYQHGPHDFEYEFNYIQEKTGKLPAIRGFDYLNCNPLYGYPLHQNSDGTTDRIINWVNENNGIATSSWHLNVPKNMDNYTLGSQVDWGQSTYSVKNDDGTPATNFVTSNVLKEGTAEYDYYMLSLQYLAEELKKLQDAGVPLIFRPLHEAEGGGGENGSWFWWGKEGSAVYKEIWKLTYETLTEKYGLHNLIWEWNSYAYSSSQNWYPGDEYVDLIAYDKYNCTDWSTGSAVLKHNDSAISSTFYNIMEKYGNKKMVAMAENDSIPTLENLTTEKAGWLYFCPWYDGGQDNINFLSNPIFNRVEDLVEIYQSDYCITLDELPADLYSEGRVIDTRPTTTKDPNATTTTTTAPKVPDNMIPALGITEKSGSYVVDFSQAIGDTIILDFEANSNVTFANGGVGVSAPVDGANYWVNYQWQISKSGQLELKLDKAFNVTLDNEEVTDEAAIAKAIEASHSAKTVEVQIWWANDGAGESVATSNVVLKNAYLPKAAGGEDTTTEPEQTTTEAGTTETTTTESVASSETTEADTTTVTETVSSDTTTTETTTGVVLPSDVLVGDVNLDGMIDLSDAILLCKINAGAVTATPEQRANAECRVDGIVDSNDATALLRFLVHLESELPVSE